MRTLILAATLACLTATAAAADETTVIEHRDGPDVVVRERPAAVIERRDVDVVPPGGCESKTVTRTDDTGASTTVHKERCD